MTAKYVQGKLTSSILIDYDTVVAQECDRRFKRYSKEHEACMEKASADVNKKYDNAKGICDDVVWHRGSFPQLTCDVSRHGHYLPNEVKKKLGTDCVLYATPDLADQEKYTYISKGSYDAIIGICVDPDTALVSEDVDASGHPWHSKEGRNDYYLSKLVTLREYRDKGLHYQYPEVLVPGSVSNDRVLGGVDLIRGKNFPYKCACEKPEGRALLGAASREYE